MPKSLEFRRVIRVFIASPSDLSKERARFPEIIAEVNKIKANSKEIHLEPAGWEDTLPGKGRPQRLINKDIKNCDLIVMLLWKRWGSPTGKYTSGFEEEYKLAKSLIRRTGKPEVWLYFHSVADSMLADPGEQLGKVLDFRHMIEREKRFLYGVYKSVDEWEKLFREHLCQWLDEQPSTASSVDLLRKQSFAEAYDIPQIRDLQFFLPSASECRVKGLEQIQKQDEGIVFGSELKIQKGIETELHIQFFFGAPQRLRNITIGFPNSFEEKKYNERPNIIEYRKPFVVEEISHLEREITKDWHGFWHVEYPFPRFMPNGECFVACILVLGNTCGRFPLHFELSTEEAKNSLKAILWVEVSGKDDELEEEEEAEIEREKEKEGLEEEEELEAKTSQMTQRHKLTESLINARSSAEELTRLPINHNIANTSPSGRGVLIIADDRYKDAINKLRKEHGSKYEFLTNSLVRGRAFLNMRNRKNDLSDFKSELDKNSKEIIKYIDEIVNVRPKAANHKLREE